MSSWRRRTPSGVPGKPINTRAYDSDSDLYTFGYRFKPWVGAPIASAEEILKYIGEVIEENGIAEHIRYGHRIVGCSWSSQDDLWTVEAIRLADGAAVKFTCNFLWMCQGYYDHENPEPVRLFRPVPEHATGRMFRKDMDFTRWSHFDIAKP